MLTYKDQRWQLTKGWNRIHWPIEPAVPIEPPVEQTGFEILPWLLGGAAVVIGLVVVHKSAK